MMKKPAIWATDCPSCKTGTVLLFEKGGLGECDGCKKTFTTDYEEHPELGTPQTEYWIDEEQPLTIPSDRLG